MELIQIAQYLQVASGVYTKGLHIFCVESVDWQCLGQEITFNSGFLDYVEPYGDIMADRGFCIRDALALRNATFNIPPFTNKKCLSSHAVTKIRRIARARIHVERCIGRLKCFKILSGLIPLSLKKELLDIIIVFCASLCNMDKNLVN